MILLSIVIFFHAYYNIIVSGIQVLSLKNNKNLTFLLHIFITVKKHIVDKTFLLVNSTTRITNLAGSFLFVLQRFSDYAPPCIHR